MPPALSKLVLDCHEASVAISCARLRPLGLIGSRLVPHPSTHRLQLRIDRFASSEFQSYFAEPNSAFNGWHVDVILTLGPKVLLCGAFRLGQPDSTGPGTSFGQGSRSCFVEVRRATPCNLSKRNLPEPYSTLRRLVLLEAWGLLGLISSAPTQSRASSAQLPRLSRFFAGLR